MPNYDAGALCCIGMIVVFGLLVNIMEITLIARQLTYCTEHYKGEVFECPYYPLITRLVCVCFIGLTSFVCLVASGMLVCFEEMGITLLETVFIYLLYIIFGPLLLSVCFFFLFNFEQYGYTCNRQYQKVYNPAMRFFLAVLCFIAILVTVLSCIKGLMRKMSCILRNNNNCFTRFLNFLLCASGERAVMETQHGRQQFRRGVADTEEIVGLREQQIRPQL